MTNQERIQIAVGIQARDLKRLDKEYDARFNGLPVNGFGEVYAERVIALNEWHKREVEKINRAFLNRIATCRKDVEQ
jgi:hypothetical protein